MKSEVERVRPPDASPNKEFQYLTKSYFPESSKEKSVELVRSGQRRRSELTCISLRLELKAAKSRPDESVAGPIRSCC